MIKKSLHWFFHLYYDGFTQMRIGKKLWAIMIIKVFILFVIVKWLFFPDILQEKFHTDTARSNYVLDHLTGENNASH